LPILTVLIFVLNFHIKQSLKTQFSDNRHIIHTRETLPLGAPYAEAKFKFEPDFFNIERSNAVALVALFTSAMAVDAFIIARGNQGARRDVVDKILHEVCIFSMPFEQLHML
jgi:hypothetical protein